jgi:acrylyl-CoA reductase (NADPH)
MGAPENPRCGAKQKYSLQVREQIAMANFRALVIDRGEKSLIATFKSVDESIFMAGDVDVRVTHSTVNYKDGLAFSGRIPVKPLPLIGGIDFCGVVTASSNPKFKAGDEVILNGYGASERYHGGYAERARVRAEWLVKKPDGFTAAETMAIGTAGYTAMLCVLALEDHGITPDKGPVVVSGAAGGVGSIAVSLLSRLGYHVIASTGRREEETYLKSIGAAEIIDRAELSGPAQSWGKERWAGAIDVAGSTTLANLITQTKYGGCVAATGLAQGTDLPGNVLPFILRAITLQGVDSVMAPMAKRERAWSRLARDLDRETLAAVTTTHKFEAVPQLAKDILDGKVRGRVVIEIG